MKISWPACSRSFGMHMGQGTPRGKRSGNKVRQTQTHRASRLRPIRSADAWPTPSSSSLGSLPSSTRPAHVHTLAVKEGKKMEAAKSLFCVPSILFRFFLVRIAAVQPVGKCASLLVAAAFFPLFSPALPPVAACACVFCRALSRQCKSNTIKYNINPTPR